MPEPVATIWLVILGSGGYVLAVVQFFKDYLGVRKLEIEIAELRRTREERERLIVKASADDIQKYGRPHASIHRRNLSSSIALLGVCVIGGTLLILKSYEHSQELSAVPPVSRAPTESRPDGTVTHSVRGSLDSVVRIKEMEMEKQALTERIEELEQENLMLRESIEGSMKSKHH